MRLPGRNIRRLAPVLLLAVACAAPPKGSGTVEAPQTRPPDPSPGVLAGMLVLGHEARSFTSCGEEDGAWVVDATPGRVLTETYESLAHSPYEPLFVEVGATSGPAPAEGFGAEYSRQLTVHELRRASLEGPGCGEDTSRFLFRAMGNEPSWNLVIEAAGIRLTRMSSPGVVRFPYEPPTRRADLQLFESTVEKPHTVIRVELSDEPCTDTMSGAWSGYRATVRLEEQEFAGCAYAGRPFRGGPGWARHSVERTTRGCGQPPDDACTWFRFDWPEPLSGLDAPAGEAIRARIAASIRKPLNDGESPAPPQELIERWEAEYARFKREFPDSAQGRMVLRSVTLISSPPSVVSLKTDETTYTGGAHPNRRVEYATLDSGSGRPLTLAEVLGNGESERLTRLAEVQFRRLRKIAPDVGLSEAGFDFEGDRFALPGNFAVTTGGLVFHYDAYEIAPYATGPTTLELDSPEVRELLRPDFRLP